MAESPAPAGQIVGVKILAKMFDVDERRVQQLAKEGMPTAGRGKYPLIPCIQWYINYWRSRAERGGSANDPDSLAAARTRKARADARIAETQAAGAEGLVITIEEHTRLVSATHGRAAAVLRTVPSKYLGRILTARTDLDAQAIGEAIRDETLAALQGAADDLDDADFAAASTAA